MIVFCHLVYGVTPITAAGTSRGRWVMVMLAVVFVIVCSES